MAELEACWSQSLGRAKKMMLPVGKGATLARLSNGHSLTTRAVRTVFTAMRPTRTTLFAVQQTVHHLRLV